MPIGRLICSENTDVEHYGQYQKQLLFSFILPEPVDQKAAEVVEKDVEHHQQHELWLAPAVEHKVYEEQKQVPEFARGYVVYQKRYYQIGKEKD